MTFLKFKRNSPTDFVGSGGAVGVVVERYPDAKFAPESIQPVCHPRTPAVGSICPSLGYGLGNKLSVLSRVADNSREK